MIAAANYYCNILRGASVVEGPIDRVYGMREVIVEDCHGLRLAFGEDSADSRRAAGIA